MDPEGTERRTLYTLMKMNFNLGTTFEQKAYNYMQIDVTLLPTLRSNAFTGKHLGVEERLRDAVSYRRLDTQILSRLVSTHFPQR